MANFYDRFATAAARFPSLPAIELQAADQLPATPQANWSSKEPASPRGFTPRAWSPTTASRFWRTTMRAGLPLTWESCA